MKKTYRIGLAAFAQESNTFAPHLATAGDFELRAGEEILAAYQGTNTELGGFLDACQHHGWIPVPLRSAWATSGGPLEDAGFDKLCERICRDAAGSAVDAILLCLHGAMCTPAHASADAEVARRLRAAIGDSVPVIATHDFHAHVVPEILESIDGLIGYRTYPHVDMRETGLRTGHLLARVLSGEKVTNFHLRIPMLITPQASSTFEQPLLAVMQNLETTFCEEDGAYASLFCVQPWLDLPSLGGSVVVSSCGTQDDVPETMVRLAKNLWSIRHRFVSPWIAPEQLIAAIRATPQRPILLSEGHDAPSGGAAGDHTGVLSLLLPLAGEFRMALFLVDPDVATHACRAGCGAVIETEIGARLDPRWSQPVFIRATVVHSSEGEFTYQGQAYHGKRLCMGRTAVLAIGGMRIVVASRAVAMHDPQLFISQGVLPGEQDVVAIKSPTLFRASYAEISRTVLNVDMPGVCSGALASLPYRAVRRPLFPLDDFDWQVSAPEVKRISPTRSLTNTRSLSVD